MAKYTVLKNGLHARGRDRGANFSTVLQPANPPRIQLSLLLL